MILANQELVLTRLLNFMMMILSLQLTLIYNKISTASHRHLFTFLLHKRTIFMMNLKQLFLMNKKSNSDSFKCRIWIMLNNKNWTLMRSIIHNMITIFLSPRYFIHPLLLFLLFLLLLFFLKIRIPFIVHFHVHLRQ